MGKALKSWSGIRKYLEEEMLADSLRGRVRYSCTSFKGMDGDCIFEIFVDNKSVKRFSMETVASNLYVGEKPVDLQEYWKTYWEEKDKTPLEKRREFDDAEFSKALKEYRESDIFDALHSIDPVVRMFAILDRRVGKRTLENLKECVKSQPEWLKAFYILRFRAENIAF